MGKLINSKRTVIDNIEFASETEAKRYQDLKLLLRAGEIRDLILQPEFLLVAAHRKCPKCFTQTPTSKKSTKCPKCKTVMKTIREMKYIADFQYLTNEGQLIIEDVKGSKKYRTDKFRLKEKFFEALYPDKTISVYVPPGRK